MSCTRPALLALVAALAACAEPVCDPGTTWEGHVDGFFIEYCQACHAAGSPARYGAPSVITFDTQDDVRAHAAAVEARLADGSMPPGGGIPADETQRILDWLACDAAR